MTTSDMDQVTRGSGAPVAAAAVMAIKALWEEAAPPLPGPVPLWSSEALLTACGAAVRQTAPRTGGRSRTIVTAQVLGAVVSYARLLHPTGLRVLDLTITCPDPSCLALRREGQDVVLVDLVRNPNTYAALLDASTEAAARAALATGATFVRAVNPFAPRTSGVLWAGSPSWQPWQTWDELSVAPGRPEVA